MHHRRASQVGHNTKDCFDQGIAEIRLLALFNKIDPCGKQPLVQLLDYFYYKEHLFIVTELLRDSVLYFYRYLQATEPGGQRAYFTLPRLARFAKQDPLSILNGECAYGGSDERIDLHVAA